MNRDNILADIGKLPFTEKSVVDELVRVSKIDRYAADIHRHDADIQSRLSKVLTGDEMARVRHPNYWLEKTERITKSYDVIEKYSHDLQRKLANAEKMIRTVTQSPHEQSIDRMIKADISAQAKLREDQIFWRRQPAEIERRRQSFENIDRRVFEETQRWAEQSRKFQDYGSPISKNIYVNGVDSFLDQYERIHRRIPISAWDEHRAITEQIIKPVIAYSRFNRRTLNRYETNDDPSTRIAYLLSIDMAERQMNDGLQLVDEILPVDAYGDGNAESDSQIIPINLFENQRGELRENVENLFWDESDNAFDYSPSAQISKKFESCLASINRCNQAGRQFHSEQIFIVDNSLHLVSYQIFYAVADSEMTFVRIVNHLNRLIFGMDKNNHNLLFDNLLMGEEMMILKSLKSLQNNFSSSHLGGRKLYDGSDNELDASLRFLGFDEYPVKSKDFKRLQLNLYTKLEQFLGLLETRLKSKNGQ